MSKLLLRRSRAAAQQHTPCSSDLASRLYIFVPVLNLGPPVPGGADASSTGGLHRVHCAVMPACIRCRAGRMDWHAHGRRRSFNHCTYYMLYMMQGSNQASHGMTSRSLVRVTSGPALQSWVIRAAPHLSPRSSGGRGLAWKVPSSCLARCVSHRLRHQPQPFSPASSSTTWTQQANPKFHVTQGN